jgi:hypothetical protein
MEFLPVDYYILLQDGFDQSPQPPLEKTNYILYHNLPLLVRKRSYLNQQTEIVKNITFEEVARSLDRAEAEALLHDPFAQDELLRHLQAKFGPIDQFFHINYNA